MSTSTNSSKQITCWFFWMFHSSKWWMHTLWDVWDPYCTHISQHTTSVLDRLFWKKYRNWNTMHFAGEALHNSTEQMQKYWNNCLIASCEKFGNQSEPALYIQLSLFATTMSIIIYSAVRPTNRIMGLIKFSLCYLCRIKKLHVFMSEVIFTLPNWYVQGKEV